MYMSLVFGFSVSASVSVLQLVGGWRLAVGGSLVSFVSFLILFAFFRCGRYALHIINCCYSVPNTGRGIYMCAVILVWSG
ncbi:hypothetical protein DENSPDRAFT_554605 [Dentipellis sp. KUC8613]|nr:hypothetical protein DENSPDRAFT_554605 [Dentipellis sp. KUC8613]